MEMLRYFIAFLVFFAGFAVIDANVNGAFKHNILMGSFGYLLVISAAMIFFFIKGLDKSPSRCYNKYIKRRKEVKDYESNWYYSSH